MNFTVNLPPAYTWTLIALQMCIKKKHHQNKYNVLTFIKRDFLSKALSQRVHKVILPQWFDLSMLC